MITEEHGNLLESPAHILVNAINCVGVMGGGLALAFKEAYPRMFEQYQRLCRLHAIKPAGMPFVWPMDTAGTRHIYNFTTKDHWKDPSKIEWVEAGLPILRAFCEDYRASKGVIPDVALPPLGCGLGGLKWHEVGPLVVENFGSYDGDVTVYFYP